MGVTIHFDGALAGQAQYNELLRRVQDFASQHHWGLDPIPKAKRALQRVRGEQNWDYEGLTRGILAHPHQNSEPLRFEFDEQLYVQEFCKTQFAGAETHMLIVALLRDIAPLFEKLSVFDEGEYWETSDLDRLDHHLRSIDSQIARMIDDNPSYRACVRESNGRILDLTR